MILALLSRLICFALHIDSSMGSFPKPLSKSEEEEYFQKMAEGDRSARNKLIEHNLRLVAHIVRKYSSQNTDKDEQISIGTVGLIKAVDTFDYNKGIKFATYASRCIENEILMDFRITKKSSKDVYINEAVTSKRKKICSIYKFFCISSEQNAFTYFSAYAVCPSGGSFFIVLDAI